MNWADGPMALFDLETTGPEPTTARIVTATIVLRRPSIDPDVHTWLADPGIDIPAGATEVHGITTEYARSHGRPAGEVIDEVATELTLAWGLGFPVVAYNGAFDLTVLSCERARHGQPFEVGGPVIDPMVIDKAMDRYRKGSRKLPDVCAHYKVDLNGAHDATEDALAAGRVAWRLARRFPQVGKLALADLHERQTGWYATQQHSFAEYLRTRVAGQVEREAEEAEYQGDLEQAEQKRAEVADLVARADEIDASAECWPLRNGGAA